MAEDNQDNNTSKNDGHVPFLAPVDEQVRSGNMGLYLGGDQDPNEKIKRLFILAILALTVIGLLVKGVFFDEKAREEERQEMLRQVQEFEAYIDEKERMSREAEFRK
ncbi:MAG: hypothetical protein OEY94_03235 [Alphaproteobacteria bacterium]|nr:hypothetical protein [Alphaproteobacteria bacterium]